MEQQAIKVLYLDDEAINLTGFKATFRRFYEIHTATTAQEAIEILASKEIHLIMIDQRMPDVTGVEFLRMIKEDFPDPIKILVTGYIDLGDLLDDAVKNGDVYRCINKPWTETEIRIAIEEAYNTYRFKLGKRQELKAFKNELSDSLKAPIANLEGLLTLARNEIGDEQALNDYFEYMNKTLDNLKNRLNKLLEDRLVEQDKLD